MTPLPVGRPVSSASLQTSVRPDGVKVRWVSALADVGKGGQAAIRWRSWPPM
jgi:two-component system heavy metal sensor histidine kinase CusS